METIEIYIYDITKKGLVDKLLEENENLGFEKNKIDQIRTKNKYALIDFHFNPRHLVGFWIDPDVDDDTNTIDIVLYIGSSSFRTPFTRNKEVRLMQLLTENK